MECSLWISAQGLSFDCMKRSSSSSFLWKHVNSPQISCWSTFHDVWLQVNCSHERLDRQASKVWAATNLWHLIQSKTCQAMGPVGAPAPGLTNVAWYLNCQLCKLWVAAFSKAGEFLWRAVSLGYPVKSATGCKRAAGNPIHQKLRLSWLCCVQTWPDLRCGRQTRWDSAGAICSLYSDAGAYRSDIWTNTQSYTVLCIKSGAFENLRGLESISSAVEGSFHTRRPRRSGLGHRCLRDSRNSQGSVVGASRSRNLYFLQTIHVEGSWLKTITEWK